MNNNNIDVNYISNLAKIGITKQEADEFGAQLSNIIEYCQKINSANVENIPPMLHAFSEDEDNFWTEDDALVDGDVSILLKNSKNIRDNQVVVPKIV